MSTTSNVEAVIQKVERYAETITSVAAIALSAVDTSAFPPKYAAIVVGVSNATRFLNKSIPLIQKKTLKVETDAAATMAQVKQWEKSTFEPAPTHESTSTPVSSAT